MARIRELDVVANNLANAETIGFKRDAPIFETALASALRGIDGDPTEGAAGRAFVGTDSMMTDFRSGSVEHTGGALDVALSGRGWFEVETPEGPRYTRAGAFRVHPESYIETTSGYPVMGEGGRIAVDRPVKIGASGEVVDNLDAVVGRLRVVEFENPNVLQKAGDNLFQAAEGVEPQIVTDFRLVPESVEKSNVSSLSELSNLVILQRAFDANMQAIRTGDSTTARLIQEFLS